MKLFPTFTSIPFDYTYLFSSLAGGRLRRTSSNGSIGSRRSSQSSVGGDTSDQSQSRRVKTRLVE